MRVTYLLNQEKLEYNYKVLKKREEENGAIISAQKRKINRLAETLNNLKLKSLNQDKHLVQQSHSLQTEFSHLNQQYKQAFKKFKLFQQLDADRYKQVWKMNEEEAGRVMEKVLVADKIIHTQQLGMEWSEPREVVGGMDPGSFYESTIDLGHNGTGKMSLAARYVKKEKSDIVSKAMNMICEEAGFLVIIGLMIG
jgi:dynein regulatry complex protein 1